MENVLSDDPINLGINLDFRHYRFIDFLSCFVLFEVPLCPVTDPAMDV